MEPLLLSDELLLLPALEPVREADRSLVCSTVVTLRILLGTKGSFLVLLIVLVELLREDGEGREAEVLLLLEGTSGGPAGVDVLSFRGDVGEYLAVVPSLLDRFDRDVEDAEPRPLSLRARIACGVSCGIGIVGLQ